MGFSVLMSIYEKEKPEYFREAIDSVLAQTMPPDEIVLVEDGPLPLELDCVIEEYHKKHSILKLVQLKENVKLGKALAEGLRYCSCEFVARMDTDDIAVKDRFEKQYNYMQEHGNVSVVGGSICEFGERGGEVRIKKMPLSHEEIREYAKYRNPLNHMTVMFRKEDVLEAGGYEHFPFLEDYDLWCRLLANRKVLNNLPDVLVNARCGDGLYGRRGGWKYFTRYCKLRKKQRGLGLLNWLEYCISIVLTFGVTVPGNRIRKVIYRYVLRRNDNKLQNIEKRPF
ncbi:glycosyltransferase [Murimonas intestini]|uniref:Glycosyl transferase family 2 n=2 Tax=Murimonas intestini TaxID=1337051 RepID=A0AB73SZ59_9FIRM|nr:glycosyltransferase [Murimonas intestini]MCR1842984.1 glycosyltransferase [Murimonas intestini]MCR1867985.1 glycosyltransferase [Murimonas intestini]MCR1885453.1 glycosyltransferase [Murimonas intestini]